MKIKNMRVVITGANSYIGNNIQSYIKRNDKSLEVCQLDVVDEKWRRFDFSGYDAVVHVAAIVHRRDVNSWEIYNNVNVKLTSEIAEKAKNQGVKQFIFLSSMAVYGVEKSLSKKKGVISHKTKLKPSSMYGKSKYLAEQKLIELENDNFSVAIVRPPNVYGPGCKGGYITTYASIVAKLPAIPKAFTSVKQSVIYIDNLSRFIYLLIVQQRRGVYTPQDGETICAVDIMQCIGEALDLKKKVSSFWGVFMYLTFFIPLVVKGYGGVSYPINESHHKEFDYLTVSAKEGIERTVLYETQCGNSNI